MPRCYTLAQVRAILQLSRSHFDRLHKAGQLPMLEELRPRMGTARRYRADLVDRWVANQFSTLAFRRRA